MVSWLVVESLRPTMTKVGSSTRLDGVVELDGVSRELRDVAVDGPGPPSPETRSHETGPGVPLRGVAGSRARYANTRSGGARRRDGALDGGQRVLLAAVVVVAWWRTAGGLAGATVGERRPPWRPPVRSRDDGDGPPPWRAPACSTVRSSSSLVKCLSKVCRRVYRVPCEGFGAADDADRRAGRQGGRQHPRAARLGEPLRPPAAAALRRRLPALRPRGRAPRP